MPRLGRRAAAAELDAFGDFGLERTRPAVGAGLGRRAGEVHMDDRGFRVLIAKLGLQVRQGPADPRIRRRLVVEVAVDPIGHPRRAKGGKAFVEQPAGLAELRIGAVAQRQHGIAHAVEARCIGSHQRGMEVDRPLRRIALAPGAGDHQQVLHAGELRGRGIRHVEHARGEAEFPRRLAGDIGERFGVAGFRAEQDGERCATGRRRGGSRLRSGRGLVARQEAAQPGPLFDAGRGHDPVERGDLIGREGRGLGQHGQAWHDLLPQAVARLDVGAQDIGAASCHAAINGRSATTGPTTISVGASRGIVPDVASACASVVMTTRWRGVVASVMKATGSSALRPAARSRAAITPTRRSAM